jgi:hypothetical protein
MFLIGMVLKLKMSQNSLVSIAMGYRLDGQGLIPGRGKESFLSPGVKLTTHLHLVPRSRMVELYLHSPICLHGVVLIKHLAEEDIISMEFTFSLWKSEVCMQRLHHLGSLIIYQI